VPRKASVVIEKDERGFYAWCPELKGCQSQGSTLEEALANIKEAIEVYMETLPADERDVLLRSEILMTAVEVNVTQASRPVPPALLPVEIENIRIGADLKVARAQGFGLEWQEDRAVGAFARGQPGLHQGNRRSGGCRAQL
jgi:predicted RNase H-like HicB family nuclease